MVESPMTFTLTTETSPDAKGRQRFLLTWTQRYPQCPTHRPNADGTYPRAQVFFTVAATLRDALIARGHGVHRAYIER